MIGDLIDFILHIDRHLETFALQNGALIYGLLFLIVFAETGLVVTPFLPGDSLLFAVGALAAYSGELAPDGLVRLEIVIPLLLLAAFAGDNTNYWIGRKMGGWMVSQRWFKKDYLAKTEQFFTKHGGKAIILARFAPIIRTFAPFTAGFGRMAYRRFLLFSVAGALLWVFIFVLGGYFLGQIPVVKKNLKLVFLLIIVVSLLPLVIEFLRHRAEAKKARDAAGS